MSPSEELVESSPRLLRLTEPQVAELTRLSRSLIGTSDWWGSDKDSLEQPREVIGIEQRGNHHYKVTVRNAVGALGLPGLDLIVVPKIPMTHFAYIASRALIPSERLDVNQVELAGGTGFVELVAGWFIDTLETLLVQGLSRGYHDHSAVLPTVRGEVDLLASVSNWLSGRVELACTYDEFDLDTPINRVLRAACESVSQNRHVGEAIRSRAARAVRTFSSVSPMRAADARARLDRSSFRYDRALELAKQVLIGEGRALSSGRLASGSFLLPTPHLIEDGIRNILASGLKPVRVEKRGRVLLPSTVRVNPDLEIDRHPFTGDVKYKISGQGWGRADLAQAVFFATAYRSPKAIVVSFRDVASRYLDSLKIGSVDVSSILWDARASRSPLDSEVELISAFRHLLAVAHEGSRFGGGRSVSAFRRGEFSALP
jgi:hypothetical protein